MFKIKILAMALLLPALAQAQVYEFDADDWAARHNIHHRTHHFYGSDYQQPVIIVAPPGPYGYGGYAPYGYGNYYPIGVPLNETNQALINLEFYESLNGR
jgi:hypothetical protein